MRRKFGGGRALALMAAIGVIGVGAAPALRAQPAAAAPAIDIRLGPSHERFRPRIDLAARESSALLSEWLGPVARPALVVADHHDAGASAVVELPWRSAPATMDIESQVAYGLAHYWWPAWSNDQATRIAANGVAWYLQSRIVERLYDFTYFNPGHDADALRFFGGVIPWEFPLLRMRRDTAGLGRPEFLRGQGARGWQQPGRRLPTSLEHQSIRMALAFGSLERLVGWPALQGALAASAREARANAMSAERLVAILGEATGRDVAWLFELARNPVASVDYAIGSFAFGPCPAAACILTRVTVNRLGDGIFSGSSRPPDGGYDSGDAVVVRVAFVDGQQAEARWDGRRTTKVFEFESPAAPSGAQLDPDRMMLLDVNAINHNRLAVPATNVPIGKWVARWLVWVQDAALSYASLF